MDTSKEDMDTSAMDTSDVDISILDGNGGYQQIPMETFYEDPCRQGLWIHIGREDPGLEEWLTQYANLDPVVIDSLVAEETRPRFYVKGKGLMIILRGVNLNPGADPDDMISVRAWVSRDKIITIHYRNVMAIKDVITSLEEGEGPCDSGEFLFELADRLAFRMADVMASLEDAIDQYEDDMIDHEGPQQELRSEINDFRRRVIRLRRYLAPQKETLINVLGIKADWLSDRHRQHLREVSDRMTRYMEDLDAGRERAMLAGDELENRLREETGKRLYGLSLITLIFLPLGLITGLLGINVGGIPGAENSYAFSGVCGILVVAVVFQMIILKKMRWW